jgi:hypothetical protein
LSRDKDTVGEFKITQECDHEVALRDRQDRQKRIQKFGLIAIELK